MDILKLGNKEKQYQRSDIDGKSAIEVIVHRDKLIEDTHAFGADIKDIEVDKNTLIIYLENGGCILINNKNKIVRALMMDRLKDERS